jgi:hypothetical protein
MDMYIHIGYVYMIHTNIRLLSRNPDFIPEKLFTVYVG